MFGPSYQVSGDRVLVGDFLGALRGAVYGRAELPYGAKAGDIIRITYTSPWATRSASFRLPRAGLFNPVYFIVEEKPFIIEVEVF